MIKPEFVVPVEMVIVDRGTNSASLINMIEELHPAGYPLLIPRFTVYALTSREAGDPSEAVARASILMDGEEIFADDQELAFGDAVLIRSLLQFQGFVLPRAGVLRLRFSVGDSEVSSYPIPAFPASGTPTFEQYPSEVGPTGGLANDSPPAESTSDA